jgi:hypothetical protein
MFYPVKIKDGKGKVKKVLPSKKLSQDYWDSYFDGLKKKVPLNLKNKGQKNKGELDPPNDEYTLE